MDRISAVPRAPFQRPVFPVGNQIRKKNKEEDIKMKKANKLLAMVLAVLMLAALCACSTGTDASTPTDSPEASATPDAAQPTEAPSRDETVDFVVVGAGAGGVSTAIEAVRQGKKRGAA